jgi:signal transduction histidine kinase/DNA-binding response OmpR family regulator
MARDDLDGAGLAFFRGGCELGALVRAKDWSATPLGPPDAWSSALRTTVSLVTANRFPQLLWWGPDYISIYNDAYAPVLGAKHPWALGLPFREVWPEVANVLGPMIDQPFHGGPSSWTDDIQLEIRRYGYAGETHFNFAYSPVPDDTAPRGIGGVLCTVIEITEKVVGERRLAALHDIAARSAQARTVQDACASVGEALARHPMDAPFALIYLLDDDGKGARLASVSGAAPGDPVAPEFVALRGRRASWPFGLAAQTLETVVVDDLAERFDVLPPGPWSDPPRTALVIPISTGGQLVGFLAAGTSSRLRLDDQHRTFFDLVAGQIATAIGSAKAYEQERERAEALAAIDRAKTAFFSNVSHEFRTPLTLMLGPLEDAMADAEAPLSGEQHRRVEMAQRNGLRLQKLVNALLDYSRVEAGRAQAAYRSTDLGVFTADIASSFRSACDKGGLGLTVHLRSMTEPVFVDREMWEKIVLNLVSNAFKYTLEGGIDVSLAEEDQQAVLRVRDTGVGIPEAELPRIFERFHRIAGSPGRTHEGAGIGLALVQELVHLHGGTIAVQSRLGEGTTFTVRIPLGVAHLPQERVAAESAPVADPARARAFVAEALRWAPGAIIADDVEGPLPALAGAKASILIADDNADMREYLLQLLGQRYDVRMVANGAEALEALRERRPDILLADIMMPRLDGYGLLRAVRADPALADLPVLLLSARAGEEATVEGLDAGADDYLTKPFSARELIARLSANLERARARRQAKEGEQRFQISQEHLGMALSTGQVGVFEWDMDADRVSVFGPLAAFYGVAVEAAGGGELPSAAFLAAIHPDDLARVRQTVGFAVETGAPVELEHRVLGSGQERVLLARGDLRVKPDGRPCLTGTIIDVTEDRLAQRKLQAQQQVLETLNAELGERVALEVAERRLLADIVERTEAFVMVSDMDFRLMAINRAAADEFERLYGVRPAVGDSLLDILADRPACQAGVRKAWTRVLEGEEYTVVAQFGEPGRDQRSYEIKASLLRDATGAQIGAYQFVYDVTDRIREQERLAQAEEQLRHAQKMEAMGQLTGGVAHDFNNLLTPIIGALDMLLRDASGGDRQRRLLGAAFQSADRARTLVQRLLAFARRQPLQPTAVDVGSIVAGMTDLLTSTAGPQVRIAVDIAPDLEPAMADQNQLEMALLNLSVNARDAMPNGGTVRISATNAEVAPGERKDLKPGRYIRLSVADTGVGMDEATQARAVEPFFSTKGIGKGTGLGLSMVHGLIQQLGGAMTLTSRLGQGTTVELWVPRSEQPLQAPEEEAEVGEHEPGRGLALLVDDEELVRVSTAAMLTELGYSVQEVSSAEEAIALFDQGMRPDLVVTDHLMPGMSGADLARAVETRSFDAPVLIISGYADADGIDPALPRLTKPFVNAELAAALAALH